jgi:hypothetical protein
MKIYIDSKMVQRNGKIGNILKWISFGLLGIGVLMLFSQDQMLANQMYTMLYFIAMIVAIFLSSISNYLNSRFGKSPRPDELLDKALKGLDDKHSIYHYKLSIPHLLVGPSSLWVLIPTFVDGNITYDAKKKRWTQKGGSFVNRFFSREAFPNPQKDLEIYKKDLEKFLQKKGLNVDLPIKAAVILMNKKSVVVESDQNNFDDKLIIPYDKIKDRLRKSGKEIEPLPLNIISAIDEIQEK